MKLKGISNEGLRRIARVVKSQGRTQYEIQKELQRTDWEDAYMGIMGYDNSISYSDTTEEDIEGSAENLRSQHEDVDESQVEKAKRYLRLMQEWEAASDDVDGNNEDSKSVSLTNPWSGSNSKEMTWVEIEEWASKYIHSSDRSAWLEDAKNAFDADDSDTLGEMIIGS